MRPTVIWPPNAFFLAKLIVQLHIVQSRTTTHDV